MITTNAIAQTAPGAFAPLYGPQEVPLWSVEQFVEAWRGDALGPHRYTNVMYVHRADQVDVKFATEQRLTQYGAAAFFGRVIIEFTDNPDWQSNAGMFFSRSMSAEAFDEAGLAPGTAALVVNERQRVPGFGSVAAIVKMTPELQALREQRWASLS